MLAQGLSPDLPTCNLILQKPVGKTWGEFALETGLSLRQNSADIDPATTHLPQLVPFVLRMSEKTKKALRSSQRKPFYQKNSPTVKAILNEIDLRVQSESVTYEWVYALSLRVPFFLEMGEIDKAEDRKDYVTHESFMTAVKEDRTSLFAAYRRSLERFPDSICIPMPDQLGFRSMNRLWAERIYPNGQIWQAEFGELDRRVFNIFMYTVHEVFHTENDHLEPRSFFLRKRLEKFLLEKVEIYGGTLGNDLQMVHEYIFHERGYMWTFAKFSTEEIFEQMTSNFEELDWRLESTPDLVSELVPRAKGYNSVAIRRVINRMKAQYLEIVNATLVEHRQEIGELLAEAKRSRRSGNVK
jgi:hypothetical protein